MSDSGKRWEDEPSTQGLGLLQSALGIPNSPLYTKGELSFKQQQELIDATKNLTSQISNQDMRVVATDPYTNIQVLESVEEQIKDGFRSYIRRAEEENAAREWARENERIERENREAEREREKRSQLQRQAVIIGRGIEDMRREVGNVGLGVSVANSHLGHLKKSTSSIDQGVTRVANTLDKVTRGQALQTEYLEQIQETINSCSRDTNILLEDLTALAIENIQQQVEQQEMTREVIQEAFERAIGAVVFGLEVLMNEITSRLDLVNRNLEGINETALNIHGAIKKNTNEARANTAAIISAGSANTEIITNEARANTAAISSEIQANTIAVTDAIREQTASACDLAYRSREIMALQYRENGRELLEAGLFKEALRKLLEAGKYFMDFETSFLLAQNYIKLNQTETAYSTLRGTIKLAQSSAEQGRSKAVYAQLLKTTGQEEEGIYMAKEALLAYPAVLYGELKGFWSNQDAVFTMLKKLREQNIDNPNALGLCLVEFSKCDVSDLMEAVLEDLNSAFAKGKGIPNLNEEMVNDTFPYLLSILKSYLFQKKWNLSPEMCFWLSKILMERNEDEADARKLIIEGIKNDTIIKDLLRKRDYRGVIQYLQLKLGEDLYRLKKYYEVPSSIRNLL